MYYSNYILTELEECNVYLYFGYFKMLLTVWKIPLTSLFFGLKPGKTAINSI